MAIGRQGYRDMTIDMKISILNVDRLLRERTKQTSFIYFFFILEGGCQLQKKQSNLYRHAKGYGLRHISKIKMCMALNKSLPNLVID